MESRNASVYCHLKDDDSFPVSRFASDTFVGSMASCLLFRLRLVRQSARRPRSSGQARRSPPYFSPHGGLVLPFINTVTDRGRRGARLARRAEGEYREYLTDEQRREAGCIGGRMPPYL